MVREGECEGWVLSLDNHIICQCAVCCNISFCQLLSRWLTFQVGPAYIIKPRAFSFKNILEPLLQCLWVLGVCCWPLLALLNCTD